MTECLVKVTLLDSDYVAVPSCVEPSATDAVVDCSHADAHVFGCLLDGEQSVFLVRLYRFEQAFAPSEESLSQLLGGHRDGDVLSGLQDAVDVKRIHFVLVAVVFSSR